MLPTSDPDALYERLVDMVKSDPPHKIVKMLKQMHDIIAGKTLFGEPLFQLLAKGVDAYEGDQFDNAMVTLFYQFHFVIALEIRAVRMLRSFLVITEKGLQYDKDLLIILETT